MAAQQIELGLGKGIGHQQTRNRSLVRELDPNSYRVHPAIKITSTGNKILSLCSGNSSRDEELGPDFEGV
jgi:hypothetical protein